MPEQSGPMEAQQATQVSDQMNALDSQIERTKNLASRVMDRFNDVLRPGYPVDATALSGEKEKELCSHANTLRSFRQRIDAIAGTLDAMLEAAEL